MENKKNTTEKPLNKELLEKFIVLVIEDENFIIPLEYVSEIVRVDEITEAPHQPDWVKGIMNLRNSVISLIDTRKRLGAKSVASTVRKFIDTIKKAHINWVETLEKSIKNGVPFELTFDPNMCAYGKWANEFVNNPKELEAIKVKLKEMAVPHGKLHRLGKEAMSLLSENKQAEAIDLYEQTIKNGLLKEMLHHFDELYEVLQKIHKKEIAVILEYEGINFAMLADAIQKMKVFPPERRQKGSLTDSQFVLGVYDDEEGLYQELDLNGILRGSEKEIAALSEMKD
jgi:chemotaxis signal transduction protein